MSCEQTPTVLHGYLDGELDAAGAAEFERHLEMCSECLAELEAQEKLRSAMQRAQLYEPAPVSLRRKVNANLPAARLAGFGLSGMWLRWLAAAAAILLVASVGWRVLPSFRGADNFDTTGAIDAHLRSLQAGHLVDVASTDQHTVKPWFDGKLDFAPPVRDFSEVGYPLIGGRLDVVNGRTAAALVYGRRKHFINLYVWPSKGADSVETALSHRGFNLVHWNRNEMSFWAVSDVAREDLEQFAQMLEH